MSDAQNEALALLGNVSIRRYLKRLLSFTDQADDALQAVAEKLLSGGTTARESRSFLRSATRNAAIDHFRANERRSQREVEFAYVHKADPLAPDAAYEQEHFFRAVDAALKELPLLTQSLFIGHYVEGRSQAELAAEHSLHLSTIEKRLSIARRHCFKRLSALRS
ncbi:MAG: RNA polymerase sigma factor [Pseudomonadota bacterium]